MNLPIVWTTLFYAWIVSEIFIAIATRTAPTAGDVQDRGTQLALWVVVFTSVTACEFIRHVIHPNLSGSTHWLNLASVILLLTGLFVRWTAIITLGKSFSANVAIKSSQTIHRAGIYRVLRHPSYLGLLLIFVAIGLYSKTWLGLAVIMIPTIAALLYRIQIEEDALSKAFGTEYDAYRRATKRLIPGLF